MCCYSIVSDIMLEDSIVPWAEWIYFLEDKTKKYDLKIKLEIPIYSEYGLDIFGDQPGKPVLKSNDCVLCVNSDWTEAKVTSFDGHIQDTYKLV